VAYKTHSPNTIFYNQITNGKLHENQSPPIRVNNILKPISYLTSDPPISNLSVYNPAGRKVLLNVNLLHSAHNKNRKSLTRAPNPPPFLLLLLTTFRAAARLTSKQLRPAQMGWPFYIKKSSPAAWAA
jgi:hypothetical protein